MRVIILHPVEYQGVLYTPQPHLYNLPEAVALALIEQGAARAFDKPKRRRK